MADEIRDALLRDAHRAIADAADAALARVANASVGTKPPPTVLDYPPADAQGDEHVLTPLEASALAQIATSDAARTGLRKLLREAAAAPLFHVFALLDGVADPQDWNGDVWVGAELVPPRADQHREMLHDAFLESYRAFRGAD